MQSLRDPDGVLAAVPGQVVVRLRRIDLGAGSELLYRNQAPELLMSLAQRARGESITASSAIEGVVASPQRAKAIIEGRRGQLRSRSEQQLAGYREALDYLFREDWRPLNVGLLLHLHRLLWAGTATPGGQFKTEDNVYLTELVHRYNAASGSGQHHPVLLVGLFVLDLTVIHPFPDGNGRVARLIANALLSDAGYEVGRWISLEQLIAESADGYYDSLRASTAGWHDGEADVWPWLGYFVEIVASGYDRFARRVAAQRTSGSKQDRVRNHVTRQAAPIFRIADIRQALPGVSDNTIRLVLNELREQGLIVSDGTGRSATWRRV